MKTKYSIGQEFKKMGMNTTSYIGEELSNGKIKYIYCHWDGYPDHNGRILKQYYNTINKVNKLLSMGNLVLLGEKIGRKQDLYTTTHREQVPGWTISYHRDVRQSWEDAKPKVVNNDIELMEIADWDNVNYIYIFERNRKWRIIEI